MICAPDLELNFYLLYLWFLKSMENQQTIFFVCLFVNKNFLVILKGQLFSSYTKEYNWTLMAKGKSKLWNHLQFTSTDCENLRFFVVLIRLPSAGITLNL